jgi:hypothetical protein
MPGMRHDGRMALNRLVFRVHAIQRMFQRSIDAADVQHVLTAGEVIEHYPSDTPYPSYLVLGWRGSRPIHVVAADNFAANETVIITVYEPESDQWESDFRRRKA